MYSFKLKTALAAAAIAVVSTTSAFAATTYHATSNVKEGAGNHSLWFSNDGSNPANPDGATGDRPNHFLFENGSLGFGKFVVDGTSASLTGELANDNGQAFLIEMYLTEFDYDGTNAGLKKMSSGQDTSDWTLYDLDPSKTSTLTYVDGTGDAPLQSFVFSSLKGGTAAKPYKVQVGTGANDKDEDLFGLSSWFMLTETSCSGTCDTYTGDLNIVLAPVPLPAAGFMLLAGMGGMFAMRRRKKSA